MTESDPPVPDQLAAEISEAIAQVERGQVVDLGSFAQYADDDDEAIPAAPARMHESDPEHRFDRIVSARIVLQRTVCSCGWRSPARWNLDTAVNDLLLHQAAAGTGA